MLDPGKRPDLVWLPVDALTVDHRYQRTLESRRSQKLIETIAANFRWSAFQAILATRSGKAYLVIDGQHRVEAARRCNLAEVPAVVTDAVSLAEQAAAFVQANTSRVSVTPYALYHARLAAGEPEALAVDRLCKAAGLSIPRYPIPADKLQPGQTLALATIAKLPRAVGDGVAALALRTVATAFAQRVGAARAQIISATATVLANTPAERRASVADAAVRSLAERGPAWFASRAISRRDKLGGTEISALCQILDEEIRRLSDEASADSTDSFIKPLTREQLMRGRA
jgi:ParB-like chromosome segregation protein Spo0J